MLTKYGEICEASFDMDFPAIADEDMEDTFMLARQLAPNTLFRGRGTSCTTMSGKCFHMELPSSLSALHLQQCSTWSLQPHTHAVSPGMGGKREDGGYGDYDTPEETFPDKPIPGTYTCDIGVLDDGTVTVAVSVALPTMVHDHGSFSFWEALCVNL
eukprot:COSAG02_NODE_5135_length_4599_cov_1.829333_4_plen_157_part_00